MNQHHFEKWSEVAKKLQEPIQAITELNFKTLQGINFIKPDELAHIKKPEELLEKQINLAIENGHKALDYMQDSFEILKKSMFSLFEEAKKAAEENSYGSK
jgi:hypothetical protein